MTFLGERSVDGDKERLKAINESIAALDEQIKALMGDRVLIQQRIWTAEFPQGVPTLNVDTLGGWETQWTIQGPGLGGNATLGGVDPGGMIAYNATQPPQQLRMQRQQELAMQQVNLEQQLRDQQRMMQTPRVWLEPQVPTTPERPAHWFRQLLQQQGVMRGGVQPGGGGQDPAGRLPEADPGGPQQTQPLPDPPPE